MKSQDNANDINSQFDRKVLNLINTIIICPLSKKSMIDPVFAMDGYTYERNEIQKFLKINGVSPITKQSLVGKEQLIPNRNLKTFIFQLQGKQPRRQQTSVKQKVVLQRQKAPFQSASLYSPKNEVKSNKTQNLKSQQNIRYMLPNVQNGKIVNREALKPLGKFQQDPNLKLLRLNTRTLNEAKDNVKARSEVKEKQYANGKYIGCFKNDRRIGKGIYLFSNGDVYIGSYENDVRHGNGIFYWFNGDVYQGQFQYGKKCGKGIMQWADGSYYEGTFDQDLKHGQGRFKWGVMASAKDMGNVYQGHFNKDKREGYGKLKQLNGDFYEGQFANNKFHGYGKLTSGGRTFQGNFIEGQYAPNQKEKVLPNLEAKFQSIINNISKGQSDIKAQAPLSASGIRSNISELKKTSQSDIQDYSNKESPNKNSDHQDKQIAMIEKNVTNSYANQHDIAANIRIQKDSLSSKNDYQYNAPENLNIQKHSQSWKNDYQHNVPANINIQKNSESLKKVHEVKVEEIKPKNPIKMNMNQFQAVDNFNSQITRKKKQFQQYVSDPKSYYYCGSNFNNQQKLKERISLSKVNSEIKTRGIISKNNKKN